MLHPTPDEIAYMQAHASDDRRAPFVGVNIACLVLAFVAVSLRVIARIKIGTKIGLDDWLIILAACMVSGHVICLLITVRYGMARHGIWVTNIKTFAILSLVAQTFYNLCITIIKLSILCLYGRIFRRTIGWFVPTLYGTALFVGFLAIPQCLVYILKCVPINSLWIDYGPEMKVYCINFQAAIIAFGIIHIVTDWWILALPIPIVMGLQLERRTKWSICSLFLMGLFVCVISIVRLFYAKRAESSDPSWDFVPISLISTAEGCSGILAACMPTWRPLFKFLRNGINSYFSSGSKNSNHSNLQYGNTTNVGRGSIFSRNRSKSRKAHVKIDHNGMGTGMMNNIRGIAMPTKRSETSMSGESVEKILKHTEIELYDTKPSPNPSAGTADMPSRGPPRKKGDTPLNFSEPGCAYEAKAGADRWEGLMKQQRLKNESDERERGRATSPKGKGRGRYGDVAYGGRMSAGSETGARVGSSSEDNRGRGAGLGLEGIVVTKTVSSITGESR